MKLLMVSMDRAPLLEKAALLESKGIPIHLDEVPHVGAVPSHLYVLLDKHFEDAEALLEDTDHRVAEPVFAEELEMLAVESRQASAQLRERLLYRLLVGVLALMSVFYVAAQLFG
ncbi:MAG: hypothetical protein ABJ322_07240 [Marinobacter sp.]|uniref:hypothetical protein n=1 Tax=Marinobacter sp. TaxID=50741 RepID=UPI00329919D3